MINVGRAFLQDWLQSLDFAILRLGQRILQITQRLELQSANKNIVIVVDEAHLLDQATLEDLRLLTNQDMDRRSPVSILILAQHWLRFVLQKQGYEALYQRLRLRFALEGLSEEQTFAYIKHHLTSVVPLATSLTAKRLLAFTLPLKAFFAKLTTSLLNACYALFLATRKPLMTKSFSGFSTIAKLPDSRSSPGYQKAG